MFRKLKKRNMETAEIKNKINILDMKTIISKMKSALSGINNR